MPWYHIYTDESGINNRYLVIGGISLTPRREEILLKLIRTFRENSGMDRELKWRKVSKAMLLQYYNFVKIFFVDPYPRFRCIVVDKYGKVWNKWKREDSKTSFYKAYYWLIRGHVSFHGGFRCRIYCHRMGGTKEEKKFEKLRFFVNRQLGYPRWNRSNYVSSINLVSSKEYDLIQLVDIFIGAVGAAWNNITTSHAKLSLMRYICNLANADRLDTRIEKKKFNIWPIDGFKPD